MALQDDYQPPLEVPVWHPLLRTASLLRLGGGEAEALMCLAEALASPDPPPQTPLDILDLVAADLRQCRRELEIFDDPAIGATGEDLRVTRSYLTRIIQEMKFLEKNPPGAEDARNPVRSLAAARIPGEPLAALGQLGGVVAAFYEEAAPPPRLVADPLWAITAGVVCDLGYLAGVLREQAGRCAGGLRGELTRWVEILEKELDILRITLPGTRESGADQAVTRDEIPVPGRLDPDLDPEP